MKLKVSGNQRPFEQMSLTKWLLIFNTRIYMHFALHVFGSSLIKTLVKSMIVKYNPSLISRNKVIQLAKWQLRKIPSAKNAEIMHNL